MKITQILTLITALFSGAALAADSAQVVPPVSLTGKKAVAQLKESGQYDSLAAAYEAARHAVRPNEEEPPTDSQDTRPVSPGHQNILTTTNP